MIDAAKMSLALILFIAVAAWWNWYWVAPRGKVMELTSVCLSSKGLEMNESNWNQCWKIVTDNQRRQRE